MSSSSSLAKSGIVRVLALPLSRRPKLTYYHVMQPPAPETTGGPNLLKRGVTKAVQLWDKMGDKPEGNWQRRIYVYGQKLMDRLEYEELALKVVDPSRAAPDGAVLLHPTTQPGGKLEPAAEWAAYLQERMPRHRRGALTWALISPLTAPFMIVPIIPNLPFFFCVWRAWSHWQAFSGARYLSTLPLRSESSPTLDTIYADSLDKEQELDEEHAKRVIGAFGLPPHSASEILRAVEQARARREKLDGETGGGGGEKNGQRS